MNDNNLYNQFIALHKPQLESSAVPQNFWETLYHKLTTETFDAGMVVQLLVFEDEDEENTPRSAFQEFIRPSYTLQVAAEKGIKANDPNAIYLIDHAWTFLLENARKDLIENETLTNRLCGLTGVDLEDEDRVNKVIRRMWPYCHAYSVSADNLSPEVRATSIWYVMDEVGSAVLHSDEPNFRIVPFMHLNTQTTYSLLFPIKDCDFEEQITRDFAEYVSKDAPERAALLLPWRPADLRDKSFLQIEPDADYFLTGHIPETYSKMKPQAPQLNGNQPLKVYAEYDVVRENLDAGCFELVSSEEEADVLWLTRHFKNFEDLSENMPNKFINQFPFEYVLTIKDLLSIISRRAAPEHHNASTLETYPVWLPTTYNLKTELLQFVSYFQHRADQQLDNHWIVKPWNLARGMDTHISNSIEQIMRLPVTGPKIAQKYIHQSVLFYREDLEAKVKFDVRYVLLLKSVQPLEAYIDRKFYLRFANKPFSLDDLDDYEKHFTVMNYREESSKLRHIKCEDFLIHWAKQYPEHDWSAIEDDICRMLHELLLCATQTSPPCSIAACPQSRAMYAADIMLEWREDALGKAYMQPKLLEVNWTPDCKRACDYYPQFFNDIFKLLFLNEENDESFRILQEN